MASGIPARASARRRMVRGVNHPWTQTGLWPACWFRVLQVVVQGVVDKTFAAHLVQLGLQLLYNFVRHLFVQRQIQLCAIETQNGFQPRNTFLLGSVAAGRVTS